LKVPTDAGQAVIAAVTAATTPRKGMPLHQSQADALCELVQGDDSHRGTPELIVHSHGDRVCCEDGTALAPEIAEMIACDAAITTVVDTPWGPVTIKRDPAPSKLQRRWLRMRHQTCQYPGCDHAGRFDAHHVVERRHHGKTRLKNLVRLCAFHHRLVHALGLLLTLHPDRRLEVRFPAGNPVERTISFAPFVAPAPANADWITGQWTGERLNLDYIHLAVESRELAAARS